MEKNNLIEKINRLLPSVEGEEENLITAAKIREILMCVYDAGVTDTLLSKYVKVTGYGNTILSKSSLPTLKTDTMMSYSAYSKQLSPITLNLFHIGQNLFIADNTNKVSANVVVEDINTDLNIVTISANETLVDSNDCSMIVYFLDIIETFQSEIRGNNILAIGSNVNYIDDSAPIFQTFELTKPLINEINDVTKSNSLYVEDPYCYNLVDNNNKFLLMDLTNAINYPLTLLEHSIITNNNETFGFVVLLKLDFQEKIDLSNSENWQLQTDVVADPRSTLIIQDGYQAEGRVLTCGPYGIAQWAEIAATLIKGYGEFSAMMEGCLANGLRSLAEGENTVANGEASHSEGIWSHADLDHSHAEGFWTNTTGLGAHSEGFETMAHGDYSHAEGGKTLTIKEYSSAKGYASIAYFPSMQAFASGRFSEFGDCQSTRWIQYISGRCSGEFIELSMPELIVFLNNKTYALTLDFTGRLENGEGSFMARYNVLINVMAETCEILGEFNCERSVFFGSIRSVSFDMAIRTYYFSPAFCVKVITERNTENFRCMVKIEANEIGY